MAVAMQIVAASDEPSTQKIKLALALNNKPVAAATRMVITRFSFPEVVGVSPPPHYADNLNYPSSVWPLNETYTDLKTARMWIGFLR
jgi:hypothetical protein